MVADFIESYAKLIVSHENKVFIETKTLEDNLLQIIIYAHKDDLGKLIGKGGNMINSLKTIINACKIKDKVSYKIQIEENINS